MTSKEIKATKAAELSTNEWLKEIAYQLAFSNEPKPLGRPKVKDANRA